MGRGAHLAWNTDLPLKEDISQTQTPQTSSAVVQCKQGLSRSLYLLKEENQFFLYILAFNLSNTVVIVFISICNDYCLPGTCSQW